LGLDFRSISEPLDIFKPGNDIMWSALHETNVRWEMARVWNKASSGRDSKNKRGLTN
jgi:hypothetical protein